MIWVDYYYQGSGNAQPRSCLRSTYLCPQQGRYFGDKGSLVAVIDLFQTGIQDLKSRSLPPYGIMAAWRLPSDVLCDERCDEVDEIVGPNLLVASIMLDNDLCNSPFHLASSVDSYRASQFTTHTRSSRRRRSL